ncbi:MAG: carboxypeptidase regulatory-like domain-containing protein, partial [Acidobacteria bacterium]|nr:carboxypeptidase regulatory-like domain-containing protein [Acidobacteriota bacterium]
MKRHYMGAALVCLLIGINAFSQVGINATLSGTVSDPTGALIPGVEVTATNTGTGVVSTALTNESGTYRFASLQPGAYEVKAELSGFQPQTFRLTLGTAQQIRQNFTLQVGTVAQAVEVTVAADELLTASTASVGTVLPSSQMLDLPLVGRNVMDLVTQTMPGVTGDGAADTTFAGITANASANVGIAMDGVTMNTGRHTQGLKTTFFVNPDMVDEMRVVVAP